MDQNDRQIIDGLFGKIRQAEAQSGPRDTDAEAHISNYVTARFESQGGGRRFRFG